MCILGLREKFTRAPGEWQEEMQNLCPDRELLDAATTIIGNHLVDLTFCVDVLASELNLSRSSLHRKLRALTNQSATEFIKFVRINKSIKIIESGETNIDEIASGWASIRIPTFRCVLKNSLG